MSKCMKDALQSVMERDGVTQEQLDSNPDLRLQMMGRINSLISIYGIGVKNHQDRIVGDKKCMMTM